MKIIYHSLINRLRGPRAGSNVIIFNKGKSPRVWTNDEKSNSAVIRLSVNTTVAVVNEGDVLTFRDLVHYPHTLNVNDNDDLLDNSLFQVGPHFNMFTVPMIPEGHKQVKLDTTMSNITASLMGELDPSITINPVILNVEIKTLNKGNIASLERDGYKVGIDESCYYKFNIYNGDLRILVDGVRDKAFALAKGIEVVPKGLIIDTEVMGLGDSITKLFNC